MSNYDILVKFLIEKNILEKDKEIFQLFKSLPNNQKELLFKKAMLVDTPMSNILLIYKYSTISKDAVKEVLLEIIDPRNKYLENSHHEEKLELLFSLKPEIKLSIESRYFINNSDDVLRLIFMNIPVNEKMVYYFVDYAVSNELEKPLAWLTKHQKLKFIPYHEDMYYKALNKAFLERKLPKVEEIKEIPNFIKIVYEQIEEDFSMILKKTNDMNYPVMTFNKVHVKNSPEFTKCLRDFYTMYLNDKLHHKLATKTQENKNQHRKVRKV